LTAVDLDAPSWYRSRVRPLHICTLLALVVSAGVAVGLFGVGANSLVAGKQPWLFSGTLLAVGALAMALTTGAFFRHRKSWAFLIGTWVVVGFCAFFAPPKVLDLPKVKPTTMSSRAEAIEAENTRIKREVMAVCLGFTAPFALLCVGFALGRRDFERVA
jgi:hypothetical protein